MKFSNNTNQSELPKSSILNANRFSGLAQIDPSSLGITRGGKERVKGVYKDVHDLSARRCQQSGNPKCEGYNAKDRPPIVGSERVKLTKVSKCCDNAMKLLSAIRENVETIIKFKKEKSTKSGIDTMLWREVGKYMEVLGELGKIDKNLQESINNVQRLCKAARNLLGVGLTATKAAGPSLGMKASHEAEEGKEGE
jgi:hypothetical protein